MSNPQKIKTAKATRLKTAANKSHSYSETLRKLGIRNPNGRNIDTLREALRSNHVSTRHFSY